MERIIAACGLDCTDCLIGLMPTDEQAAEKVISWFKQEGWLKENEGLKQALHRNMYCQGCHGNRSIHWSADCDILRCCVDDKGLQYCYECEDFQCERLTKWAEGNNAYSEALQRLHTLRNS